MMAALHHDNQKYSTNSHILSKYFQVVFPEL